MPNHLQSKTVAGLAVLLAVTVGLALAGKLSDQAVEAIKYIGGSYMAVRMVANGAEPFKRQDG